MIERYNEFVNIWKSDSRIISILGNHDIAGYIIYNDCTNRTIKFGTMAKRITTAIESNLSESYLIYKIGDYIFSHAGVKSRVVNDIQYPYHNYAEDIMNCKKRMDRQTSYPIYVLFIHFDWSGNGSNKHQSCVD